MITVNILDDGSIEGYVSVSEFAKKNNIPEQTVRQWILRGHLPALKIKVKGKCVSNFIKIGSEVTLHNHKIIVNY